MLPSFDVAGEPVNGEVHLGELDGIAGLLLTVYGELLAGIASVTLDEMGGLHEHAA